VFVVPPILSWIGTFVPRPPSLSGADDVSDKTWSFDHQKAFVGCTLTLNLSAADSSTGLNSTGVLTTSPYVVGIELADNSLGLPTGMEVKAASLSDSGKGSTRMLHYAVPRGQEGSLYTVCFRAAESHGAAELPVACIRFAVQRCMYCAQASETLESIMREVVGDSNWLRLWAVNGNEDGDPLTPTMSHPDQLLEGSVSNPDNPTQGSPFHVGNVYEAQIGDSVVELASMFHTTVKEILRMNPDITQGGVYLQTGQEVCIMPCTRIPSPSNDYGLAY